MGLEVRLTMLEQEDARGRVIVCDGGGGCCWCGLGLGLAVEEEEGMM